MGPSSRPLATPARRRLSGDDASARITPLHVALWNGNLEQIEDGLARETDALETRDPRGNRALHLALKFAHRNSKAIVKSLLAAGARVRSRDEDGWKTVHHAIASENEDILSLLIQREKEQAPGLLHKKISDVAPRLAEVPDFYCELQVDVATWIPGVSRWLPSDTVKIWKRGGDLRFDITLVGFENGSWQRGNLSFLLLGNDCQFLCLDHDEKTCTNLLVPGDKLEDGDLASMVHFLMTTTIMTTEVDVSALTFDRKRSWLTKCEVTEDIGGWNKCGVYDMTGMEVVVRIRRPQNKHHKAPEAFIHSQNSTTKDAISVLQEVAAEPCSEVLIEPKSEHVVSVELAANETLKWRFRIDSCDIGFSVRLLCDGSNHRDTNFEQELVAPQRLSSNHEHGGSFTSTSAGTVVIKWDNKYSLFRQKRIHFQLSVGASDTKSTDSEDWDSHRATEHLMTFEEWFGVAIDELPEELRALNPKHRIMVHQQPPCRTLTKAFPATVYTSTAFPVSVDQFLPVIEVLSKTTSAFENVREFFNARLEDGFPVQFCFPLVPSVSATFRFNRMELGTPTPSLFVVPRNFAHFQEDMLSPRTHHEMLQNLTAV